MSETTDDQKKLLALVLIMSLTGGSSGTVVSNMLSDKRDVLTLEQAEKMEKRMMTRIADLMELQRREFEVRLREERQK